MKACIYEQRDFKTGLIILDLRFQIFIFKKDFNKCSKISQNPINSKNPRLQQRGHITLLYVDICGINTIEPFSCIINIILYINNNNNINSSSSCSSSGGGGSSSIKTQTAFSAKRAGR